MEMILEAKNLSFSYIKGTPILKNVSLGVEEGSVTCLMGPNGSGKTTLLDCLMGMLRPESGEITLLENRFPDIKERNSPAVSPTFRRVIR